jgi:Flp pilus assembly protein TadG
MHATTGPLRERQGGTASVEAAICLPVLLFLMLSSAELGRVFSQYNTLTKSVRDACRYVAANAAAGTTGIVSITPQLQTAAANLVVTGNVAGTGSALLPNLAAGNVTVSDAGGGFVSVSVAYTYQPMIGATLPTFGFGNPVSLALPLNAAVIMRAL